MHWLKRSISIYFTLLLMITCLSAMGVIYVRPMWSNQQYENMSIRTVDVNVDIQDQIAVTPVDQTSFNKIKAVVMLICNDTRCPYPLNIKIKS